MYSDVCLQQGCSDNSLRRNRTPEITLARETSFTTEVDPDTQGQGPCTNDVCHFLVFNVDPLPLVCVHLVLPNLSDVIFINPRLVHATYFKLILLRLIPGIAKGSV